MLNLLLDVLKSDEVFMLRKIEVEIMLKCFAKEGESETMFKIIEKSIVSFASELDKEKLSIDQYIQNDQCDTE